MKVQRNERGFNVLWHEEYPPRDNNQKRLLQESSAIGDYGDSMEKPGSSCLWVGDNHHLDREQVAELVGCLSRWVATGSLAEDHPTNPDETRERMPDPKVCFEIAQIDEDRWDSFDVATRGALAILADCRDRRGLSGELDMIDEETISEIVDAWAEIIRIAFNDAL